jgi:hypothetical protein
MAVYTAKAIPHGKETMRGKCWCRMFPDRVSASARVGASQRLGDRWMHASARGAPFDPTNADAKRPIARRGDS